MIKEVGRVETDWVACTIRIIISCTISVRGVEESGGWVRREILISKEVSISAVLEVKFKELMG